MTAKFKWGKTSKFNLYGKVLGVGLKPELIMLCDLVLAASQRDFMIVDGMRTLAEQKINLQKGFSKTMKSKHLLGRAIDFAPVVKGQEGKYIPDWVDLKAFQHIGALYKKIAKEKGIKITWGGDWRWKDWGHIQLDAT